MQLVEVQVFFRDGKSPERIRTFDTNRQIQSVHFTLVPTPLKLTMSDHPNGSRSPDITMSNRPSSSRSAAAVQTEVAEVPCSEPSPAVNPSPPPTQTSAAGMNNAHAQGGEGGGEGAGGVQGDQDVKYVEQMRGWIMVVATLFASMMFQAGLNPPGGFWSNDLQDSANSYPLPSAASTSNNSVIAANGANLNISISPPLSSILSSNLSTFILSVSRIDPPQNVTGHAAGEPVLATKRPGLYIGYIVVTTIALLYSLLLIFYLLSGRTPRSFTTLRALKTFAFINILLVWVSYFLGMTTNDRSMDVYIYLFFGLLSGAAVFILMAHPVPSSAPTPGIELPVHQQTTPEN